MPKPIESLNNTDANAFQEVLRPHIIAVLQAAGIIAGGATAARVFVQADQPTVAGPWIWIEPVAGSYRFWIEE